MTKLYPHRFWMAAFAAALALLFASDPLLRAGREVLKERLHQIETKRAGIKQAIGHLRDDAKMAEELSHAMNASDAETYLASVDRLGITAQFEPLAIASRLSHFTYTLSPEQPLKSFPINPDLDGLMESTLTIEAKAPHDGDVYRFFESLQQVLPGRAQLQRLIVARLSQDDKAAFTTVNVAVTASYGWLANAALKPEER